MTKTQNAATRGRWEHLVRGPGRAAGCAAAATLLLIAPAWTLYAAAGSELDDAISLYQAARYGEALQILESLDRPAPPGGVETTSLAAPAVSEYRALCLLALDRPVEARDVIKRLLARQPEYRPRGEDLPPRFIQLAHEVRVEMLPHLVRSEYKVGKTSYDRNAYAEAEAHLRTALTLADDQDLEPATKEGLSDVREVANGFLTLIAKAKTEGESKAGVAGERAPSDGERTVSPGAHSQPSPAHAEAGAAPTTAAVPAAYEAGDEGVTAPVAIRQDVPQWRALGAENEFLKRAAGTSAILEVLIDEHGDVQETRLRSSLHPMYDSRLLAAAKHWKYRPAIKDGAAVPYRKLIDIRVEK